MSGRVQKVSVGRRGVPVWHQGVQGGFQGGSRDFRACALGLRRSQALQAPSTGRRGATVQGLGFKV